MLKIKYFASKIAVFLHLLIFIIALYFAWFHYTQNIEKANLNIESTLKLESNIKKESLEKYYTTSSSEILFWAQTGTLKLGLDTFKTTWAELGSDASKRLRRVYVDKNPFKDREKLYNPKDGTNYAILHEAMHEFLYDLKIARGYLNILLIDMDGDVLYSVAKGSYFAKNIVSKRDNLTEVFNECRATQDSGYVAFRDFRGENGSFIATAVVDENGEKMGVLVFELSKKALNGITLKQIDRDRCSSRFLKDSNSFKSYECLIFKDNYWEIESTKLIDDVYNPIKSDFIYELLVYITIAIISLILSYLILWRLLGRRDDDE